MRTHRSFNGIAWREGQVSAVSRELAVEAAVAISYNGTSHAVLMTSPCDLEDLARGFSLTEGIIASMDEVESVEVIEDEKGFDVQLRLSGDASAKLEARRRSMAGPVGCGMCGLESIEAAMRTVSPVNSPASIDGRQVCEAVRSMARNQELNMRTRSVHAAAAFLPGEGIVALREDVGRHNALDKLVGSALAKGHDLSIGAVVMTSRLSVELVQKTAAIGCPVLVAVSAPTSLAVDTAQAAGVTLAAIVRGDEFEVFTHPERIIPGALPHVA